MRDERGGFVRRIVVTEATVFIGRHVVAALLDRSADVVAVARNPTARTLPELAGAEVL
jgi:uncharacterized protein YbjT (DUF2867 family)